MLAAVICVISHVETQNLLEVVGVFKSDFLQADILADEALELGGGNFLGSVLPNGGCKPSNVHHLFTNFSKKNQTKYLTMKEF